MLLLFRKGDLRWILILILILILTIPARRQLPAVARNRCDCHNGVRVFKYVAIGTHIQCEECKLEHPLRRSNQRVCSRENMDKIYCLFNKSTNLIYFCPQAKPSQNIVLKLVFLRMNIFNFELNTCISIPDIFFDVKASAFSPDFKCE